MNDINTTLGLVNEVLSGEKNIEVEARIPNEDIIKLASALALAILIAILTANVISYK